MRCARWLSATSDQEDGPAYVESVSSADTVLVRLEPNELRGWDFADDMG